MFQNKLVLTLCVATGGVFLLLVGFLAGSNWWKPAPGPIAQNGKKDDSNDPKGSDKTSADKGKTDPDKGKADSTKSDSGNTKKGTKKGNEPPPPPPPPPPPVKSEVRFRESLQPGKTYVATTKMFFKMKGTHRDWGIIKGQIGMIYSADATMERKIERNDGRTVVELRTFNDVQTKFIEAPNLASLQIELGFAGDILVGGVRIFQPELLPAVAGGRTILEAVDLRGLATRAGLDKFVLSNIFDRNPKVRSVISISSLKGKTVRLSQTNDGVSPITVEPVGCQLTQEEYQFLAASCLPADALMFPDIEVAKGEAWEVPGRAFIGMLDPSLLSRTEGKVILRRAAEDRIQLEPGLKERVIPVEIVSGTLNFVDSTAEADKVGHFRPQTGTLLFARNEKIFIKGELKGRGNLTIRSKNHVLFEARSDIEPEITIVYSCRILGGPGKS